MPTNLMQLYSRINKSLLILSASAILNHVDDDMRMHIVRGTYVNLSGTAILLLITVSSIMLEAVFLIIY